MTWENEFKPAVLAEGKKLYEQNRVSRFYGDHNHAHGIVTEDRRYHVTINYDEYGDFVMNCDCYHGMMNEPCAHEAALLYCWMGPSTDFEQPVDEPISLFEPHAFDGCYFDLNAILQDFTVRPTEFKKAQKLLEDGWNLESRIRNTYYSTRYGEEEQVLEIRATIPSVQDLPYHTKRSIELIVARDRVIRAMCEECSVFIVDGYFNGEKQLCAHLAAAFLKIGEYVKQYNPGDETNRSGMSLLEQFSRLRVQAAEQSPDQEKRPVVTLSPRITNTHDALELSFRIGAGKMYVLKNMTDLVECVNSGETLKLGKSSQINFAQETFHPASAAYYAYLSDRVRESQSLNNTIQKRISYYSVGDINVKGSLELTGMALDEFYDRFKGHTVDYEDPYHSSVKKLRIDDSHFHYALTIQEMRRNGTFDGIRISGDSLSLMEGSQYQYFIQGDVLSRLSKEDSAVLKPFLNKNRFGTGYDDVNMQIGIRNLGEFYYRVLPLLKESPVLEINEPDADFISSQLPPEAQFIFYLDVNDNDLICRSLATYGEEIFPLNEKNETNIAYRDRHLENNAVQTVKQFFPYYDELGFFCAPKDDEKLYDLLDQGIHELMAIGTVNASDAFQRLKIRRAPSIRVGVSVTSNLMNLEISSQELTPEELLAILNSYRQKKRFHRLSDGSFISLEQEESLDTLSAMMDSMNISLKEFVEGKLHLPLYRSLYIDKMLEDHESLASDRDRNFRSLVSRFSTIRDSEYDVPEQLKDTLRNYQVYGYKWMHTLSDIGFGGILADDMGLGKTVQTISLLLAAKQEGKLENPALIICPTSVVYNWEEEFHKFAPQLRVQVIAGNLKARKDAIETLSNTDVLITSYDLLKRDIGYYENRFFSFQILDEGQFIKNPKAAVSKAVRIVKSAHRFALTGTPIENRLSELWSIFDFIMPGFLYSYENFRTWFETPITKDKDELVTEQLRRMVSPFILRRLKQDVLKDLPDKIEEVHYARFKDDQQKLYDGQVVRMREMVKTLDEHSGESRIRILAELTRIREICCDPSLIAEDYEGSSAKREACLDLIRSGIDGGHKMLVFSQFTSMLELLEEDLKKENIPYYKITGATSKEDRMTYVHRFNDDDTPVFLISLKAGGTGLNLTGADIVIHYDPWWNIAAQNQATDRAHRIGQTRNVSVFKLIVKDSVEERILEMQEAKKDLSDAILSGEATSLSKLSKEELLEILG